MSFFLILRTFKKPLFFNFPAYTRKKVSLNVSLCVHFGYFFFKIMPLKKLEGKNKLNISINFLRLVMKMDEGVLFFFFTLKPGYL